MFFLIGNKHYFCFLWTLLNITLLSSDLHGFWQGFLDFMFIHICVTFFLFWLLLRFPHDLWFDYGCVCVFILHFGFSEVFISLMSSINFGKFVVVIFSNIYSGLFFSLFSWNSTFLYVRSFVFVSEFFRSISLSLSVFFFWLISIVASSCSNVYSLICDHFSHKSAKGIHYLWVR